MFLRTDLQVLKLKFLVSSMKQAFYPFHKQNIAQACHKNCFYKHSVRYLVVKHACVNAALLINQQIEQKNRPGALLFNASCNKVAMQVFSPKL